MACVEDQQPNFKHFCRICKKGFMCGRALGGHMRAHGIGDESENIDDDDPMSDWEEKLGACDRTRYALRANPNRLKSCRVCENCGKEFSSWKSFLEHGKCGSEDVESFVSSPESEGDDDADIPGRRGCGWSKRKRSFRAKVDSFSPSSEDEDLTLAKCLMQLSNARADNLVAEPEESCASASKEEERRNPITFFNPIPVSSRIPLDHKAKGIAKGLFECKACKKVFNSHQALGGHRASHKKVKGCFAAKQDRYDYSLADEDVITHEEFFPTKPTSSYQFEHGFNAAFAGASRRKSKVHECSICHRIFSSGQALGGHKRCHWITANSPDTSSYPKFHHFRDHMEKFINKSDTLDLNLPAPADEIPGICLNPKIPLSLEVSTEIHLHPWVGGDADTKDDNHHLHHHHHHHHHQNNNNEDDIDKNNENNTNGVIQSIDDEADSKVQLAKLSDLKDMNSSGGSTRWLQVGIGSTTDVGVDP